MGTHGGSVSSGPASRWWHIKPKSKSRKFEEKHNCQSCTELTDEACSSAHEKETSSSGSGLNSKQLPRPSPIWFNVESLCPGSCRADGRECQACCIQLSKCAVCSHIFLKRTAKFLLSTLCTYSQSCLDPASIAPSCCGTELGLG